MKHSENMLFVSFDPQGELTEESNVADITYAAVLEPTQEGDEFTAQVTAPIEGVMFLRIYAKDGEMNYWSDELFVQVAE